LIGISQGLGLGIMIYKLVDAWQKSFQNREFNAKVMFEELKQYFYCMAFIAVFPFVLHYLELILASMQDALITQFNGQVNTTVFSNVQNQIEQIMTANQQQWAQGGITNVGNAICRTIVLPFEMIIYSLCMYILKYVYFMYMAGRYLWLLMLELVAPFAIICFISEKTKSYTMLWIKNMILCYLMIPCILLADVFSEQLFSVIFDSTTIEALGIFSVVTMLVIKLAMYKVATTKLYHLF
jgi:hypothetical protein